MTNPIASSVARPLWLALHAAPEPLSLRQLVAAASGSRRSVYARLRYWARAGLIEVVSTKPRQFVMTDRDSSPPAMREAAVVRRGPTQQQRIWTAMRVLKRFDLPTVSIAAEANRQAVQCYITPLVRAGFLRVVVRANPRRGEFATYQLVRRTGRLSPSIERRGRTVVLVDRNDGTRATISSGGDAAAPLGGGEG